MSSQVGRVPPKSLLVNDISVQPAVQFHRIVSKVRRVLVIIREMAKGGRGLGFVRSTDTELAGKRDEMKKETMADDGRMKLLVREMDRTKEKECGVALGGNSALCNKSPTMQ